MVQVACLTASLQEKIGIFEAVGNTELVTYLTIMMESSVQHAMFSNMDTKGGCLDRIGFVFLNTNPDTVFSVECKVLQYE